MSLALQQVMLSFVLTLALIKVLARLAPIVRLVDTPDHRKNHVGNVPLVGGIAILLTLWVSATIWSEQSGALFGAANYTLWVFLAAATALTVLGVIDDARGMSVFTRAMIEVCVALLLLEGLDIVPQNLGNLLGTGTLTLPTWAAYPFAVIAIFGVINAYNMLDGMDGLLSIMVLITIAAFHAFTNSQPGLVTLVVMASLAAFLISNLELSPYVPKVFLGDAGSKLLGFLVVSMILTVTSSRVADSKVIEPATALYLVGLPLFDMVYVTLRRVAGGRSPFHGDRHHIHHLASSLGFRHKESLLLVGSAGLALPFIGLMLEISGAAAPQQFAIFLGLFGLYCLFIHQSWRLSERYNSAWPETTKVREETEND